MAILIIAEHDHASLSDQTAKAVSAATQIGSDIHVLVPARMPRQPPTRQPSLTASPRFFMPKATNTPTGWQSRLQHWWFRLPTDTTR
jgi:electron transfer flavoprotein alpha subunit